MHIFVHFQVEMKNGAAILFQLDEMNFIQFRFAKWNSFHEGSFASFRLIREANLIYFLFKSAPPIC